jgi:hypothetical protein
MLTAVAETASCGSTCAARCFGIDTEPLITHDELAAALFALHDILEEVREIKRLLGGDDGEEEEEPEDQGGA